MHTEAQQHETLCALGGHEYYDARWVELKDDILSSNFRKSFKLCMHCKERDYAI